VQAKSVKQRNKEAREAESNGNSPADPIKASMAAADERARHKEEKTPGV
jgi:hypothetical protein